MAGTQAPKGFGLLFVLVGVPAILWSAWGASGEREALDSPAARRAQCLERTGPLSLSTADAEALCGCVVAEAERRGIGQRGGGYDRDRLGPVVELCFETHVAR